MMGKTGEMSAADKLTCCKMGSMKLTPKVKLWRSVIWGSKPLNLTTHHIGFLKSKIICLTGNYQLSCGSHKFLYMKKVMILIGAITLSLVVVAQDEGMRMRNNHGNYSFWGMHMGWWFFILVVVIAIVGWFSWSRKRKWSAPFIKFVI